jgi:adenine-specific DNA methylase
MSNKNNKAKKPDEMDKQLKIEETLPVTAVGIESVKETYPVAMSPHRRIYKWFARRPTTATRLAVLASVLPADVSNDQLLQWMCIGPSNISENIEDYVVKKDSSERKQGHSVTDHFGYDYPNQRTPSSAELEEMHSIIRDYWGGEAPTIIDPTAGGGTIPLEALRYDFPTISNELNPVAWILNKVILEYSTSVGSIEDEVRHWLDEIHNEVETEISEYFPERGGVPPSVYFRAYSITCPSCGKPLPLSNSWEFNNQQNKAIQFDVDDGELSFQVVDTDDYSGWNPKQGTVSNSEAECPHCGVVTERDTLVDKFKNEEFDYEVCGVRFAEEVEGTKYHSPRKEDYEAIAKAQEEIKSDLELATLLNTNRFEGRSDRAIPYGITKWRDLYSPRQFLTHATFLRKFSEVKGEILEKYPDEQAEVILVLLSFIGTKMIDRNSRLEPIEPNRGCPNNMLGNNNFAFQWNFGETNLLAGSFSYKDEASKILDNYEQVVDFTGGEHTQKPIVNNGDASNLPFENESVGAVVIDPPYGDNVMYAELADSLYVWLKEYLNDLFPDAFSNSETNKQDEAVENPSKISNKKDSSKRDLARKEYEAKMGEIFSESYRVLESDGVITVFFTDKETAAWDSLTSGLIDAGFTVTATHTITSENPGRVGTQGRASADSSLLLTCRKPTDSQSESQIPSLWSDIKNETREAARNKAEELLDSELNLTKTDMIISAFGPTLRVFTENYPVVDKHDNTIRPEKALEEARSAVVEVIVDRELKDSLDGVDSLSRWYILCYLVYETETISYDEARQLGLGVGVDIDDIKTTTKIWSKSRDKLTLKGQGYRVRDYDALEAGEKRRKRAYPVDPRSESFAYAIDAVHATLNVLEAKGSDFAWNWINERNLQEQENYRRTIKSSLQCLPKDESDYKSLKNLISGETGELLDIDTSIVGSRGDKDSEKRTTLQDF